MNDESFENVRIYEQMIQKAREGNEDAQRFLRRRIENSVNLIPLSLLILISEITLEHRKEELRREGQSN